jgi:excisionase family DNA binding protein
LNLRIDGSPNSPPHDRLLSRGQAARYLGVSTSTIYYWAYHGRLPYVATLGGHMRFSIGDLDVMAAQRLHR